MRQGRGSTRSVLGVVLALLAVAAMVPAGMMAWPGEDRAAPAAPDVPAVSPADEARARSAFAGLPLSFEANEGQHDPTVAFSSRGAAYDLFLTPTEAVFALPGQAEGSRGEASVLRMNLVGANPDPAIAGRDALAGKVNYLRGNDREQWQTGVSTFEKVAYDSVYPGIDLVYYGKGQELEYDFVVAPGADPSPIQLHFDGATDMTIDAGGDLVLETPAGEVRQRRPHIYQDIDGSRVLVAGSFVLGAGGAVRFNLGAYDASLPLVIDPVVVYSAYFGIGSTLVISGVAVDDTGIYLAGEAFPGSLSTKGGLEDPDFQGGNSDAFVAKLDPSGSQLLYSTHIGGPGGAEELATALAVDGEGNVYLAGEADVDFPVEKAYRPCSVNTTFMSKIRSNGAALEYSTCIPGGSNVVNMAIDSIGRAYVAGTVGGTSQFATRDGFKTEPEGESDSFIVRLNPAQEGDSSLEYATLFGGDGRDDVNGIALVTPESQSVWITGETSSRENLATDGKPPPDPPNCDSVSFCADAFVARINTDIVGSGGLETAVYYGGALPDTGFAVASGADGTVYIAGSTFSTALPGSESGFPRSLAAPGVVEQDVFLAKLSAGGSSVDYAGFLGGGGADGVPLAIAVGDAGKVHLVAVTNSPDLPVKGDQFQDGPGDNSIGDLMVAQFDTLLNDEESLLSLSYLGGSGIEGQYEFGVALRNEDLYIGTSTGSPDFPAEDGSPEFGTPRAGGSLLFKISLSQELPAFDAMSLDPSAGPQGEVVDVIGSGFDETATVSFGDNFDTEVTFVSEGLLRVSSPARNVGEEAEVPVTVTVQGVSDPDSELTFTYRPKIGQVTAGECIGFDRRLIAIGGADLDLIETVKVDGNVVPNTSGRSTEFSGSFPTKSSGSSTVEVLTKDGFVIPQDPLEYESCRDDGGTDEPPDPVDPPAPPRPGGSGNPVPPDGSGGGFTANPGTGNPPPGGFTTAPGPANVPTGGFTTPPGGAGPPGGGFATAPGSTGIPSGGFSNVPGAAKAPGGGFTTAPGATATPSGAAFPGVTPVPGGSWVPSAGPSSPPPTPNPGAPPVAPVAGASQPGAPALGSTGDDASGAASRYSMVAAEEPLGIPPVAVAGALMLALFLCALVVTSPGPRPGWQLANGTGRRGPRVRGGY